jgi:hypothetical protein
MPYSEVKQPVHMSEAFSRTDDAAVLSQAAILLILGARLRGQPAVATPSVATLQKSPDPDEEDNELAALGVPHLRPTFGRIDSQRLRGELESRYKGAYFSITADPGKIDGLVLQETANRLLAAPEDVKAAELMEGALGHENELVRVASAASYFERSSEPDRIIEILRRGAKSNEPLVCSVAATALGHIAPEDDVLRGLSLPGPSVPGVARATRTTVIVHGTWAANSPWWQPNGDFFNYLTGTLPPLSRTAPLPPLPPWDAPFGAAGYYRWSGGYSDAARAQAAQLLLQWIQNHSASGLDLITHSHGGNVVFMATQLGAQIKEAVVLSCPVHFPKYVPLFSNV